MKYEKTFQQKLDAVVAKNNSLLCVGLDTCAFHKVLVDATHDIVCAYKPNSAFYEAQGAGGIEQLKKTCAYIQKTYPEIPIILDAKRGDIGSTNEGYVSYTFDYLGVDAITLHPYLGREALGPFLDRKDKGCIILCKTSNPGAGELQDLKTSGKPLYQVIAEKVANEWNINGNCMLVVGAPYPEELSIVRRVTGDMTFLVPGIGTQGGDIEKTVKAGINAKGAGMIVNASRLIASAKNPREQAQMLRDQINTYRS